MLINAHPAKNILNLLGVIVACIFLSKGAWFKGLVSGFLLIFSGTVISTLIWKIPIEKLDGSFWGKVSLRFTTPWTFILYLVSHILIPLSFLFGNYYLFIIGIICYIIPQIVYWNK